MPRRYVSPRTLSLLTIGALALIGIGLYWQQGGFSSTPGTNATSTTTINGVTFVNGGGNVEVLGGTPPATDRPITITANLPEEAKVILRSKLEQQMEILKKEPTRMDIWLQVGVNRKIAGDFEGAIEAWDYVAAAAPTHVAYIAWGNLGDLYMYFLKDYEKADSHFKEAIRMNPKVPDYYRALFYLYLEVYKDKAAARTILDAGIAENPNNEELLSLKSKL